MAKNVVRKSPAGPSAALIAGTLLTIMLAGCGSQSEAGQGTAAEQAGPSQGAAGVEAEIDPKWAADACATLPAQAAGRAVGVAVSKTIDSANVSTSGVNVSSCTYQVEGGGMFTVGLRHDTTGASTMAESIAGLTANLEMTGPVEEVTAKRGKAFWTPRLKTLSYLPDDTRMITVTPPGADVLAAPAEDKGGGDGDAQARAAAAAAESALKARALAIAEAAAG